MKYVLVVFVMLVSLLTAVYVTAFASDEAVMVEMLHHDEAINYLMSGSIEGDVVVVRFDMGDSAHNFRFEATGNTVHFSSSVTFPAHMAVEEVSATAISDGAERDLTVILMSSVSSTPAPTRVPPTPPATLTPFVPTNTATPLPTATATQVAPSPLPTITLLPWPEPTVVPQKTCAHKIDRACLIYLPVVMADMHSGEQR